MDLSIYTAKLANILIIMKEAKGDILYLVLMIVAGAISFIAKAAKKPVINDIPEISSNNEDEFEFDDEEFDTVITNYSDDSNVKQEAEPKRKTEYQRLENTFTSKYHFENKSSKSSKKAAMEEASNENDIEYKEVEEYEWFKNPNDLQRAFVYSEILKRPDI